MATRPENLSQLSNMVPKPEKELSCQALVQLAGVSKHGFLRKMPHSWGGRLFDSVLNRKWSSKFVVLRSGCVYIYGSETASNYERAYSMFGFQEVLQCVGDVYKAGSWVFQVVDALQDSDRNRTMHFSASSESDMKEWIEAFQKEIYQGNLALFSSSSHDQVKPKPSGGSLAEKRTVLPRISEEMQAKIRESIACEKNFNICPKDEDDLSSGSDYSDIDENELERQRQKRPLPVPPIPLPSGSPAVSAAPIPRSKPTDGERLKPETPVKPVKQDPPPIPTSVKPVKKDPMPTPLPALVKPAQNDPPPTAPKLGLAKPTNAVKPLPTQPALFPRPSNTRGTVPQPPVFKTLSKPSHNKLVGDYEESAIYTEAEGDTYEQWVPGEECLSDPMIKAAYWTQDADEALKVMLSISEDGVFLIRDASDGLDYKTLMVVASEAETSVRKYKIIKEPSHTYSLHLGESGFKSLQDLVQYYKKNSLPNRTIRLTKPYSEVWKSK